MFWETECFITGLSLYFSSCLCFSVCIRNSSAEVKKSCAGRGDWQRLTHTLQTVRDSLEVGKGKAMGDHPQHPTCLLHCTATVTWNFTMERALLSTTAPSITCPSEMSGKSFTQRQKAPVAAMCGKRDQSSTRAGQVSCKGSLPGVICPENHVLHNSKRRGKRKILLPLTPSKQGEKKYQNK